MKLLLAALLLLLAVSTQSLVIHCSFRPGAWTYMQNAYTCFGNVISFVNQNIESIEGNHMTGRTNNNVEGLQLLNQRISLIPPNLATVFPNLKGLIVTGSDVASVSLSDLRPFSNLTFFRIIDSKIVSIDGDLFSFNPNLKFVGIESSPVQNVGHNLIGNLTVLSQAYFYNNTCINKAGNTPQEIQSLNRQLPISCPSLPSTYCSLRCTLNDEADEMKRQIARIDNKVTSQDQLIQEQALEISKLNEKIKKIEKKLKPTTSA
jgi:hypothetical protein